MRHSYLQFLTFRLCKLGSEGRPGITEECFANNVLEFATNFTMIAGANGRENGTFEKFEQTDLREGTYPVGSVWRPIGKIIRWTWYILRSDVNLIPSSKLPWSFIRKDSVRVPAHLPEGDYVLSLRWDVAFGKQVIFLVELIVFREFLSEHILLKVWVSCASVRLVRANKDFETYENEGPVYTNEEYEELGAHF